MAQFPNQSKAPPPLPLKKLVVEMRYPAKLEFYSKVDSLGIKLRDMFPHWERSALTLDLRNKQQHRRLFLSVKRLVIEWDSPSDKPNPFDDVAKLLEVVQADLELGSLARVGVRQWFAKDLDKSMALMVDQIRERFLKTSTRLDSIFSDTVEDLAFVSDYSTKDGWRYAVRLGPMTRDEWFERIGHEAAVFDEDSPGASLTDFRRSFPNQFLFLDLDSWKEDIEGGEVSSFFINVRQRTNELARRLISYCEE